MTELNERERATILAALRLWERTVDRNLLPEFVVATDGGTVVPMPTIEIEALCWKVNTVDLRWGDEE